ncbi:MAG: hypothetical protein JXR25_09300 [Pontiellaceae bacterium]|nr:hypothetical protein [Pontiellaceae bacterium]MBN2785011.1 hypothetical protein [Pontiellaceae bacterium]
MKKLLVCFSVAGALAMGAHAASVTWDSGQTAISGASDVSTNGVYFGSWAPYVENGGSPLPVNGVTFANDLPDYSRNSVFQNISSDFGDPASGNTNYNILLGTGIYSDSGTGAGYNGSGCVFSWGGMTVGHTYEVQLWVEDLNNTGVRRWQNIFGDEGPHGSPALDFPADGTGAGHYIIGTFRADATTQTLSIEPWDNSGSGGNQYGQVNLFQVRDITSTLPFLGITGSPTGWSTNSQRLVQAVIGHGSSTVDTGATSLSIDGDAVAASFEVTSSNTTVSFVADLSHGVHTGQVEVVGIPDGEASYTWTFQVVLEQSAPTTPLHHWDFEETSGINVSDSVGGADGTIVGSNYAWVGGGGLELSGGGTSGDWNGFTNTTASSYVNLPNDIALPGVVTFEATYAVDVDHGVARIWDFGTNVDTNEDVAGYAAQACYLMSGGPHASVSDENPQHVLFNVGGGGIAIGELVHVVWVYDANNDMTKLYRNGVLVDAQVVNGWSLSNLSGLANNLWFGRSQWSFDAMFEGKLYDIRIYSGIMTAPEVAAHYTALLEAPFIQSIGVSGTTVTLMWSDAGVGTFSLERKSDLTEASWTTVLSNMPPAGAGASTNFTDSNATGFYQIKGE